MNGKQLKNAILQLAIQGKLVPQDDSDEPASALLAQIRKEKEQLVKAGKLKKKDLETTPISDDEKPFEIPESWECVRLGEYSEIITGSTPSKLHPEYYGKEYPFYKPSELDQGINVCNSTDGLSKLGYESTRKTPAGSVLVTCIGATIGKTGLITKDGSCNQQINAILPSEIWISKLLFYFCNSAYFQNLMRVNAAATTLPIMNKSSFSEKIIPLPPLAEQYRIVAKIEELMPLVEEFGAAQEKLDRLNEALPEALKKSILQQAIQGKLVAQNPSDEPASALLARIRKEKEQLQKAGKLKKKDLETTPITDDEKPFGIPESWEWCKLQDLCYLEDGIKSNEKGILLDAKYLRGKSSAEYIQGGKHVLKGDNIILVDGENSGEVFEVPVDGIMGSTFKQLIINSVLYKPYLLMQILFYKNLFRNSKKGAAIPHLNKEIFRNLPISLPPLAEQRRIVARVEELMAMVERMK